MLKSCKGPKTTSYYPDGLIQRQSSIKNSLSLSSDDSLSLAYHRFEVITHQNSQPFTSICVARAIFFSSLHTKLRRLESRPVRAAAQSCSPVNHQVGFIRLCSVSIELAKSSINSVKLLDKPPVRNVSFQLYVGLFMRL